MTWGWRRLNPICSNFERKLRHLAEAAAAVLEAKVDELTQLAGERDQNSGEQRAKVAKQQDLLMKRNKPLACLLATLFLAVPEIGLSQNVNQNRTIIINGQSTQVSVIQVNGRSYVDLEALASAVNGSLSSAGSQIAFSLPLGSATTAPAATAATTAKLPSSAALASNPGFSKGFLNAGIETAATLREWHAALASAIQSGYSITNGMLAPYRAPATTNLRLTSIAVSTDSDRSAYQLLSNEFQNMVKLSDKYAAARANMNYIAPDALQNDSLNQRFVACGHSLGAMAASGQFVDDGSCD